MRYDCCFQRRVIATVLAPGRAVFLGRARYGDQAVVLEPPERRETIAAHARAMLNHYDNRSRP